MSGLHVGNGDRRLMLTEGGENYRGDIMDEDQSASLYQPMNKVLGDLHFNRRR